MQILSSPLTLFLTILVGNATLFLALIIFVIWRKTHVIEQRFGVIGSRYAEQLLADDVNFISHAEELSSVSKLAFGKYDDGHFVVQVTGYAPSKIDLDSPTEIRIRFSDGSANRIAYNSFEIQKECVRLYDSTRDERFVNLFWYVYREWMDDTYHCCFDDYAWYDHCVAARFVNLRYCTLVLLKHGMLSEEDHAKLVKQTIVMGSFVASNKRFDWVTNHGLISDDFLLRGAVSFPRNSISQSWIDKVLSRSVVRIDYFVSDDGIPLEGSTTYWYLIRRLYADILQVCDDSGIVVSDHFRAKLAKCTEFLIDTSIQGQINRIGDSSGGHKMPPVGARQNTEDGYYLNVCDTGLVYLNGIQDGQVVTQFLLNVQDVPPYVHRHQDALSVGLYHKGVFWINSPGSYSADKSSLAQFVKSFANQSITYCPKIGYQHECWLESIEFDKSGFSLRAIVCKSGTKILERDVCFDLSSERLKIRDRSRCSAEIRTQYLLSPVVHCDLSNPCEPALTSDRSRLDVRSNKPMSAEGGKISYGRNQLTDTNILAVTSDDHSLSIDFGNGIAHFGCARTGEDYPYVGRCPRPAGLLDGLVARLHVRRFKQILIAIFAELVVLAVVLTLI